MTTDHRVTLRRYWYLPDWGDFWDGKCPERMPRCKVGFSGVVSFSTQLDQRYGYRALVQVARDMMQRLAMENDYSGRPIGYGEGDRALIKLANGHPIGCVTTCFESDGEKLLLGAWVHPEHRRQGVMTDLWKLVVTECGPVRIHQPSPATRQWMMKMMIE